MKKIRTRVLYPEADGVAFSQADLLALRRLEPSIVEHAVVRFCITSNYQWKDDASAAGYARLIQTADNQEITSQPLAFLRNCSVPEFDEILMKRSFEIALEKKNSRRSSEGLQFPGDPKR